MKHLVITDFEILVLPVVWAGCMQIQNMFSCENFGLVVNERALSPSLPLRIIRKIRLPAGTISFLFYVESLTFCFSCGLFWRPSRPHQICFVTYSKLFTRIIFHWNSKHLSTRFTFFFVCSIFFLLHYIAVALLCMWVCVRVSVQRYKNYKRQFSNDCYLLIRLLQRKRAENKINENKFYTLTHEQL